MMASFSSFLDFSFSPSLFLLLSFFPSFLPVPFRFLFFAAVSRQRLSHVMQSLHALRTQYAGAVTLTQQEQAVHALQDLVDSKRRLEQEIAAARAEREDAQRHTDALRLQHEHMRETIAAVGSERAVTALVNAWQQRLTRSRLQTLQLQRRVHDLEAECDRHKRDAGVSRDGNAVLRVVRALLVCGLREAGAGISTLSRSHALTLSLDVADCTPPVFATERSKTRQIQLEQEAVEMTQAFEQREVTSSPASSSESQLLTFMLCRTWRLLSACFQACISTRDLTLESPHLTSQCHHVVHVCLPLHLPPPAHLRICRARG